MPSVYNSDVESTSHDHSFPVADRTEAQHRKGSFSDESIDPAIYNSIFNEVHSQEGSDNSESNSPENVDQFDDNNDNSASWMQSGQDDSIPNNNDQEDGHQIGSTFQDKSRTDAMGVGSGQSKETQHRIRHTSGNHAVLAPPQNIHNGGQMLQHDPSMREANMAPQYKKENKGGFASSQYYQTDYMGLAKTQAAAAPAPALAPASRNMELELESSQIERDLEAVASMYNMEGAGNNSNSSVSGSQHNAATSEPSAGPVISVTRRGDRTVASGPGVVIELLDDDVDDAIIESGGLSDDPNKRRRLINGAAMKSKIVGNMVFADTTTIARAVDAAAEAATARRSSMPDWMAKRSRQQQSEQHLQHGRVVDAAAGAAAARRASMPDWMGKRPRQQQSEQHMQHDMQHSMQRKAVPIQRPTASVPRPASVSSGPTTVSSGSGSGRPFSMIHEPTFVDLPDGFVPTWQLLYPMTRRPQKDKHKFFELSLLNVQEFTITGLPLTEGMTPTPVTGLRSKIKEISKPHGKPVFEKDKEGVGGKWRIPLGAYRAFFSYLNSDALTRVIGIPENQLKIASLGKARLERGFPSAGKLMSKGVPRGLASTLAPFQRGGVDFVAERKGRALIADEMGLGKTIQSIASLSMYWKEWPLLVLTPSSARYHWENEFMHWLGVDSPVNNNLGNGNGLDFGGDDEDEKEEFDLAALDENTMPLLQKSQIHVLTSSKDLIFPTADTKVVICSYGLAPTLVEKQEITPGLFRCAIVDESHMLKNMKSQRTSRLVPILNAANRCILLSGTPAFARPSELFPQLKILSTENDAWWGDERHFVKKYVKRTTPARRAELFAMLTGTIMIRRLKADILKTMPKKMREKVLTDVVSPEQRRQFHECMQMLREGKGVLGQLAKEHSALDTVDDHDSHAVSLSNENSDSRRDGRQARADLVQQYQQQYQERMRSVEHALNTNHHQLDLTQQQNFIEQQQYRIRLELDTWYKEKLHNLDQGNSMEEAEDSRKTVLNRMYTLTATAKLPFITEMIKQWLADPTKGKLCVFAHHKFVLNDLIKLTGLSNEPGSTKRYIRIDGSTAPKLRQAQINAFQTDPDIKIAILGITAAGVAVTLTASSTVWFAELFWTPALMIQAEDRCHRIGQNSRVTCLYFVAKGTLDELLWKLLEKKFRDLGEFVEGKEKMKIVVDKIYHGEKEFQSIFNKPEDDDMSYDALNFDDIDGEDNGESIFDLDDAIVGDITMLGNEEITKNLAPQGEDDAPDPQPLADETTSQPLQEKKASLGSSEADAIDLLSDDEDEKPSAPTSSSAKPNAIKTEQVASSGNGTGTAARKGCRCYNQLFDGPMFEMQLVLYQGRPIVSQRSMEKPSKPAIGDILVAVNGSTLPMLSDIKQISEYMKKLISQGSVELTFIESTGFTSHLLQNHSRPAQRPPQQMPERPPQNHGATEVIELSDDDD